MTGRPWTIAIVGSIGIQLLCPAASLAAQPCRIANYEAQLKILKDREEALSRRADAIKRSAPIGERFTPKFCAARRDALRARGARVAFEVANRNCAPASIRDLIDEEPEDLRDSEALHRRICGT